MESRKRVFWGQGVLGVEGLIRVWLMGVWIIGKRGGEGGNVFKVSEMEVHLNDHPAIAVDQHARGLRTDGRLSDRELMHSSTFLTHTIKAEDD